MWPGSYWWRGIRWQRPGPEVRLLLCYRTRLPRRLKIQQLCRGWWTRLALWVFFFSARKGEKKSGRWDDECVSVCVHACKHVHVFYFPDFHRHIRCHRIIQRFHSPSKSLFIIPSVSLGPDVLLDKLVEALEDTFRSDLRKSQTVPNYFFFKYLFYWTWPFSFSKMFLYSSRSCWMYTLHDFFLTKRHS